MSTTLSFINTNKWKLLAGILIVLGSAYYFSRGGSSSKQVTVSPTRENIKEEVEVSGFVESSKESGLSFEKSGIVSSVSVVVGQRVNAGQTLATLSGADAYASVREAEGSVAAQEAVLAQLKTGGSDAEKNLKQQVLDNAVADFENTNSQVADTIRNTNNTIRDIFDYRLVSFFSKNNTEYKMTFSTCDQTQQFAIETTRKNFDNTQITTIDEAYTVTLAVNAYITKINSLLSLSCVANDATYADKRATISSVKTSVSTVFADISTKKTLIQTAQNAITRAKKDLELTTSSADVNKIDAQKAAVDQAYARLAQARAQASKNVLTAPFAGVVTDVSIDQGEVASVGKSAVTIISDSTFQIKAKISEVDISKISVNDKAVVTLDAYGVDTKFDAVVSRIDPAATGEAGSPRYGIVLTFVNKDDKIKSGMTANAKIVTETKDNALTLPSSFIEVKNGIGMVRLLTSTTTIDKAVVIGIRGSDGKLEIISGLSETDKVAEIAKDGTVVR